MDDSSNLLLCWHVQIPKILWHHERLLDALQKRVTDDMQCVGDVLLQTVRQFIISQDVSIMIDLSVKFPSQSGSTLTMH